MAKMPRKLIRSPKQARSKETVASILEATAQILTRTGNLCCTTNLIAQKAGVSIGGLYQYFSNREEILRALCVREREKDLRAIHQTLAAMPNAPLEKVIAELLQTALERLSDQPRLRQILEYEIPHGTPREAMRALRVELSKLLHLKLLSFPEFVFPKDIELRIFVLVSGIESSFYVAIEEYGKKLDRQLLIDETQALVLSFLSRYIHS